jgi:rsbT co-antagonist protein RsbR
MAKHESLEAEVAALRQRVAELEQSEERLRQTEQDLRQNQELLNGLLDNSPAAIFIKDTEGRVVVANKKLAWLLQFESPQDIIGKTAYDLVPPEIAADVWESERQTMVTGVNLEREEMVPRGDDMRVLIATKFPIFAFDGTAQAVGGMLTDITERKKVEEELYIFRAMIENSPDAIGMMRADGTLAYVNPAFRKQLAMDEIPPGYMIADIVPPEDREHLMSDIVPNLVKDGSWLGELTYLRMDGSTFPAWVSSFVIWGEDTKPRYMVAFIRDVSDQQRQQERQRASEERLRAIVEKLPVGVCITNQQYLFEYVNPTYCQIYGYTSEELIGQPFTIVVPEENRQWANEMHDKFMQEGAEIRGEWHVVRKDGEPLTVLADAAAIIGNDGRPQKATFVIDISPLKRSEQERQLLQEQVIEAQRAALRELSAPLLPISDHVVILPLIGSVDTQRAQQIMETLLEGVAYYRADTAILDITGVAVVDTQVANALLHAAQAVQLLGAQVVLTGIGPAMAQTLVHLGADLSGIVTQGSLQSGIAYAMRRHGQQK